MDHVAALRLAVELVHMPSRVRAVRGEPLPDGVDVLLQIAAGEDATTEEAAALIDRPQQVIRQAAAFYIEQILLSPDADSYRVLGAAPWTHSGDIRRNMALLLRWLHPDVDANAERSLYAGRVTRAWEDLKTPERRATYDAALAAARPTIRKSSRQSSHQSSRQGTAPKLSAPNRGSANSGAGSRAVQVSGAHKRMHTPRPTGFLVRALHYLLGSSRR